MASHRILVVDDDEAILEMLRDYLSREHDVVTAGDGYKGLSEAMVGEERVDLITTDLNMPGMDGVELIENLPDETPVIVISGFLDSPKFERDITRVRAAAVLRKPFRLSELGDAVHEMLFE